MELFAPSSLWQSRAIPSWSRYQMNFQSRWFSSFEYLLSVLFFFFFPFFLLGQPTASGCWSIYQCGVVFSGSITVSWALLFASLHICWAFFWIFFSGLRPHLFISIVFIIFFSFVRFIAQYGVKGPRSRSDSTALVGLLVGGFLCCSLSCSDGFGFLFSPFSTCQSRYVTVCRWFLGFPSVYRPLLFYKRVLFLFI